MTDPERSVASRFASSVDTFSKAGLVYEDHHFKTADGKYERSPPSKLKGMYDYLPHDPASGSPKHVPAKLVLKGDSPEVQNNQLKDQAHCLGVYAKVPNRDVNGSPIWKHVDSDLCIASADVDGEKGWVICQFTTLGVKDNRCMQLVGPELFTSKGNNWEAWISKTWTSVPNVKVRPSYHGWGMEVTGVVSNTESSVSPPRSGSPSRRPKSPASG
uniref:Uncharacterized protein n=1 Tax=Haptolina brevifila TaxID=156173 RepID=A0A7S2I460_9EUKA